MRAQHGTAFTLALPAELKGIHPTFHASLLKPFRGTPPLRPPPIVINEQEEYEVASIVAHRHKRKGVEYLVRWKGYGAESDTWQRASDLENA